MSQEITLTVNLHVVNGNLRESVAPGQLQFDQATARMVGAVQEIGTSEETISLGDVATPGYAVFRNMSSTNYVRIGPDASGTMEPFARLRPGMLAVVPLEPGMTLKAQADTAAVDLWYKIFAE